MPRLLKLVYGTFENESRDLREIDAAKQAGFSARVLCLAAGPHAQTEDEVQGTPVTRYWPWYRFNIPGLRSAQVYFSWLAKIRRTPADVISCHDLEALQAAWLATRFMGKKRPLLVYDSHEFELGRNMERSPAAARRVARQERFYARRSALTVVVNDSIADAVQKAHRLKTRPLVVRSTPPNWALNADIIAQRRAEMLAALAAPQNSFLLMYHGAVTSGRGIEQLLQLLQLNPAIHGVVLGHTMDADYTASLHQAADRLGVAGRVLFMPAAPSHLLWQYIGAANAGLVLIQDTCASYRFALPNKLFENIQSLTPVIVSNFPEMEHIVQEYGVGLACPPNDMAAANACVEQLRCDAALYARLKENLGAAKEILCWQQEQSGLIQAYQTLAQQIENK